MQCRDISANSWYNSTIIDLLGGELRIGKRRGVVLVTVLFFVLILGLLERVILMQSPNSLAASSQSLTALEAEAAAQAGAAYARCRLQENASWKGDGNAVVVNTPRLVVVEDTGNVLGLLRDANGQISQFRIRFNYQTGGGSDPASTLNLIHNKYVSLNNLQSSTAANVPLGDPTAANWGVSAPSVGNFAAQPYTAFLCVEGRSGPGLQTFQNPNDPDVSGLTESRVVYLSLGPTGTGGACDSPLMAGGNVTFQTLGGVNITAKGTATQTSLRSKQGIRALNYGGQTGGDKLTMGNGTIGRDPVQGVNGTVNGTVTMVDEHVGDGKSFYSVPWSNVTQADPSKGAVVIPAGTYVTSKNAAGDCVITYYDMPPKTYLTLLNLTNMMPPGGIALSADLKEVRTDSASTGVNVCNFTWNIDQDIAVEPSKLGVKDFAIMPREGRERFLGDTAHFASSCANASGYTTFSQVNITGATLSSPGNTLILSDVMAQNGTLTSAGNATVASTSVVFSSNGNVTNLGTQKLSIYAKNDLEISTYQPTIATKVTGIPVSGAPPPGWTGPTTSSVSVSRFGNLQLDGLIYSWGNVTMYGGEKTYTSSSSPCSSNGGTYQPASAYLATITINGALVAFGADPSDAGGPGSNSADPGAVTMYGQAVNLCYDTSKLGGAATTGSGATGATTLVRLFYAVGP